MNVSRRTFLTVTAAGAALAAVPSCDSAGSIFGGGIAEDEGSAGALRSSQVALPTPFGRSLPIPTVLTPVRTDATTDYYEITQRKNTVEIVPGTRTEIWGYNGTFPGPTIRSRTRRRTVVTHRNELDVPVVVHLHGGRTPPEHDGYPDDWIMPVNASATVQHHTGASVTHGKRDYEYPMDQPAGTLWYHDHRMDFTGPQVYKGLAGFHLVTDDNEQRLRLPSGDRDIPLMITDRAFDSNGQFDYPSIDRTLARPGVVQEYASGVLGDCILVNGVPWPFLEVDTAKYRLRILNASNARRYLLTLDPSPTGGPAFTQIGADGALLSRPVTRTEIPIAQAERYDVIVDFADSSVGDVVNLRNGLGAGGSAIVMQFRVTRTVTDSSRIPDHLARTDALAEDQVVTSRQFWFSRGGSEHGMALWTVNGDAFTTDNIIARPRLGTVEKWTIHALNVPHPFHIHMAPVQVLSRDGDPGSNPVVPGWKDTISLDNGGRVEFLIRFDGYRGKYVFHCHNLEHEDMRMMANFEVV